MHPARSDTIATANANSDLPPNLKEKIANCALRINLLAIANGFANEMAKISFSLQNSLRMDVCDKIRWRLQNAILAGVSQSMSQECLVTIVSKRNAGHTKYCKELILTRAGVLYFSHFLGAPRETRQLKP